MERVSALENPARTSARQSIPLRVLALSYLFPNSVYPEYGIFVYNRLRAVNTSCQIKVVAPVPWFPFMQFFSRFQNFPKIPKREIFGDFEVFHPRFPIIPRYLKWVDSFSYLGTTAPLIQRLATEGSFPFDLVDTHWVYPDILTAFYLSRRFKKPFLVTVRGKEGLYLGERGLRKRLLDILLRKADFVIALSSELQGIVENIGVPRSKLRVILNGVDVEQFHPMDRELSRRRLGLPTEGKMIVSVGSLIRKKGHHEIVDALPALQREGQVSLYIVGGTGPAGDDSRFLQRRIKKLGLTNVHLVGKQNQQELLYWYNAADLFCLASLQEGCPNVVAEALACGTPVVVSNVGAVHEIVQVPDDGIVFDRGTPDDLLRSLRQAFRTSWDRMAIATRMKRRTWEDCAREVIGVYQDVLSRRKDIILPSP